MLSLCELRRAARILQQDLLNAALRRIAQIDEHSLILTFAISRNKAQVLISCNPENARISRIDLPELPSFSSTFHEYTRAHLMGSCLSGVEISETDRHVGLHLQSPSGAFLLVLSILGARSNIYLLDAERRLAHSMRPLEQTRRELKIGEPWTNPSGMVSEGSDRWENVPDAQYLQAIEKTYVQLQQKREAELLARRIEHAVKKERAFLDRKSINLQEDLGHARQAEAYLRKGELLKSVLHVIRPNDDRVLATDHQTGEVLEIPLDPRLSPSANLESYFTRYQKESRGVKMIQQQLEDLEALRGKLDAVEQQLRDMLRGETPELDILERLASQPDVRRLVNRYSHKQRAATFAKSSAEKKGFPARLLPKRYKTQDGLEIWVGCSDEGNDHLTTRLARGNDLFFHLEGYPGSHVVLRTEGRRDPSPRSLLEACELAVHFSKLKSAAVADVHVAPIKNVRKPKGAKPGLVYVRGGKTIHLRRDLKRLQSILAARLD